MSKTTEPAVASVLPLGVPGYWRNEASGVLAPLVELYLRGGRLTEAEVAIMRSYLRQWIEAPAWRGLPSEPEGVTELRRSVRTLSTHDELRAWLHKALDHGIDPL